MEQALCTPRTGTDRWSLALTRLLAGCSAVWCPTDLESPVLSELKTALQLISSNLNLPTSGELIDTLHLTRAMCLKPPVSTLHASEPAVLVLSEPHSMPDWLFGAR
jgi:hypothetical protein